jgi:ferric iron reductase protein FhuF
MGSFLSLLDVQRWDDHRFYHQSRINQTLHLISALSFLVSYAMLLVDPAMAAIIAWGVAMVTRQSGHFFFEPRGFDAVNKVTDEYKERVKVGYNMRRKAVLLTVWALVPVVLMVTPSVFGLIMPATDFNGYVHDVGTAWLALGITGVLFRVTQLWVTQSLWVGVAWMIKIVTDPFYDIGQYYKSPLALLRGELLDPMHDVQERHQTA